jgi:hypothetical protein
VSLLLAGTVAGVYVAGVVGAHRLTVFRRRSAADALPLLGRWDWDALLDGLLPVVEEGAHRDPAVPERLPSGELTPWALCRQVPESARARRAALLALVGGAPPAALEPAFMGAGFTGGELRWLQAVAQARHDPALAIARLEAAAPSSPAELYLRERLRLLHETDALNLEWSVFSAKRRLALALKRFGDQPCLYLARALASSLIGFNQAAVDDLARAVYFSGQAPFYLRIVLEWPYLQEARPALLYQCRQAQEELSLAPETAR